MGSVPQGRHCYLLDPARLHSLREGTWSTATPSDLIKWTVILRSDCHTDNLAPCQHLELHLKGNKASAAPTAVVQHEQANGWRKLHTPLYSGPAVISSWSSRSSPCRLHSSNSVVKSPNSKWRWAKFPSPGMCANDPGPPKLCTSSARRKLFHQEWEKKFKPTPSRASQASR